ncbi:MAG: hypothetical protein JEZ07_06475 [Phycisphaerae bacterium]|nr:hypothetical protein [Phycisphaerae bacterium]
MASSAHVVNDKLPGSDVNSGGGWVIGKYGLDALNYQGMYLPDGSPVAVATAETGGAVFDESYFSSPPLLGMICNHQGTRIYIDSVSYFEGTYAIGFLKLTDNSIYTAITGGDTVYFGGCFWYGSSVATGVPNADVALELDHVTRIIWFSRDEPLTYKVPMSAFCATTQSSNHTGSCHWRGFKDYPGDNPDIANQPEWFVDGTDINEAMLDISGLVNISFDRIKFRRVNSSVVGRDLLTGDTSTASFTYTNSEMQGGNKAVGATGWENLAITDTIIRDAYNIGISCSSNNAMLSNLKIYDCDGYGLTAYYGSLHNITVSGCGVGVKLYFTSADCSFALCNILSAGNTTDWDHDATVVVSPYMSNCISGGDMPEVYKQLNPLDWGIENVDPQFISLNPECADFLVPANSQVREILGLQPVDIKRLRTRY